MNEVLVLCLCVCEEEEEEEEEKKMGIRYLSVVVRENKLWKLFLGEIICFERIICLEKE